MHGRPPSSPNQLFNDFVFNGCRPSLHRAPLAPARSAARDYLARLVDLDYWVRSAASAHRDLQAESDCSVHWGWQDPDFSEPGLFGLSARAASGEHFPVGLAHSDYSADYLD